MEIAKVLATVNAAKRRGVSSNETITNQQTVVSIVMPTKIVQRFTTNTNNQVISAGSQELLTIQASALKNLSSSLKGTGNENEPARVGIAPEDPGSSKTETSGRE
jgi:hypothetical protein